MDLGKATLVGLIDRLERRSYVVRRPDPSDRRIKHILLTDEGRELIAKIRAIVGAVNGKILRATSASDIARIEELLYQMKCHLIELRATSKYQSKN
jgi:MarR family transcriptional regulator for hemolysin